MVSGPAQASLLLEFEEELFVSGPKDFKHQEEGFSTQTIFKSELTHDT